MKKSLILVLALTSCAAASTQAKRRIGPLERPQFTPSPTCACEFFTADEARKPLLLSDYAGKNAWVNIDGRDVNVPLASTTHAETFWEPGQKFTRTYSLGGTHITVELVPDEYRGGEVAKAGQREGWPMRARISVPRANVAEVTEALGECGC